MDGGREGEREGERGREREIDRESDNVEFTKCHSTKKQKWKKLLSLKPGLPTLTDQP